MTVLGLVLALLLPTAAAASVWALALGRPRTSHEWMACLGAGYVLGCVGLGAILRGAHALAVDRWFGWPALALAVFAAIGWAWAWRRPSPPPAPPMLVARDWLPGWLRGLMLLLLAGHALALFTQAITLPTAAWDAWAVWIAKPKAWVHANAVLAAVEFEPWWRSDPGTTVQILAGHYPDSLPRLVTWTASAAGGWYPSLLHLPWPLLWLALGALTYGYQRMEGIGRDQALVATLLLLSLPMVNAHAALAGYADLWLAALLALALLHALRAWRHRRLGDALLAALMVLLLPAVKLEGAVWLLCLLAAALFALLPRGLQRWALPAAALALGLAVAAGGAMLPLPGLGLVRLQWGLIEIPAMGTLALHWRPVLGQVAHSLFVLPNWHLLWFLVPVILLAAWPVLGREPWLRHGGRFFLLGYAFLFVLFFFTDASQWAENLTSLNRVLLQVVPATVVWLSFLLSPAAAVRGRWR